MTRFFAPHEGRDTVFLHLPDGGTLSHAAFLSLARRTANALTAMGVTPGDRVAVHVEKIARGAGALRRLRDGGRGSFCR